MQKTVLAQIIEMLHKNMMLSEAYYEVEFYKEIIETARCWQDKERAQIEQAYMDGRNDVSNNDGITPADYFTSKYGKDDTGT